ncbi:MAG: EAL domain-containing protein [Legionellaceae bacterium]|nr:EAL domain-containing protein [Legionellaceae bacterium]
MTRNVKQGKDKAEANFLALKAVYSKIIEKSANAIVMVDAHKKVLDVNAAASDLFELPKEVLLDGNLTLPIQLTAHAESTEEVFIPQADGTQLFFEVSILRMGWEVLPHYLLIFRDIRGKKATKQLFDYMQEKQFIDSSACQIAFEKKMVVAIQSALQAEEHMAVLHLNLDNFKVVNDTFGRAVGDILLEKIEVFLKQQVRKKDMVIRLPDDEFVIVLEHLRKPEYAGVVAQNILRGLDEPFEIAEEEIYSNVSIGAAVYPFGGDSAITLVEHAKMAMHAAKQYGKNRYHLYSDTLDEDNEHWLLILNGLRNALQKDEFYMLYQPIVDLKTGGCVGIEALLRWQHPMFGSLTPDVFLPAAEKMNLMIPIGKWVIQRVFSDFKVFDTDTLQFFTINVTADELSDKHSLESILTVIKQCDVTLEKVVFEITETSFVKEPEVLVKKLDELFKVRVRLAIDDYGTGYSSLGYLKRLPITILKIDQSFIHDMEKHPNDAFILESTIELAHNLGIKVIAEGVQEEAQVAFLKKNKCDYVQGFYFSKPLSLKDVTQFIKTHP